MFLPPDRLLSDDGRIALWRRQESGEAPAQFVCAVKAPSDSEMRALLLGEYQLRDRLDSAWACKPLEIDLSAETATLTLHDPGGELLHHSLGRRRSMDEFLRVAIGITVALRELHAIGVNHRGMRPDRMLVDAPSGQAWLVGCSLEASTQPGQRGGLNDTARARWSYLSPEQCRGGREIDGRSDLYSLGVILYQLLTGVLPFTEQNLSQLLHAHAARLPLAPADVVPALPAVVSSLVMRLLAKAPGDRYQSAAALEADLRRCQSAWQESRSIVEFELCLGDASSRIRPVQRLYGRTEELRQLRAAFDRVAEHGGCALVLLSGHPGVGKSCLVDAFCTELAGKPGLFARGKADSQRRDMPYATFAQTLQSLVRHVLGRPDNEFSTWRMALHAAVHPHGQLLRSLVPDLELVVGAQPSLAGLSPQDMQSRFREVIRRLLQVFTRPDAPLVLFLDDLQWADPATLDLIGHLLTDAAPDRVLLLGTCRDNASDRSGDLAHRIATSREAGASVEELVVPPLAPESFGPLIADHLCCTFEEVQTLTRLVHRKTGGNPFFAGQFLRELAQGRLLGFDPVTMRWTWDVDRIESEGSAGNVIGLMCTRLDRLPARTVRLLEQLACLGGPGATSELAAIAGHEQDHLGEAMQPAVLAGLVVCSDDHWALVHDRVREAAYGRLTSPERVKAHLRIGRFMLATRVRGAGDFEIVDQLNLGAAGMTTQSERDACAELNLNAARQAGVSTAYASALKYLTQGIDLIGRDPWPRCARLAIDLHLASAETEFLKGQNEAAERRLVDVVLPHVDGPVDRAATYRLLVLVDVVRCNYARAVDRAVECLKIFDISIEAHPSHEALRKALSGVEERLQGRDIEALVDLPLADSSYVDGAMAVLSELLAPACFTDEHLAVLHLCHMVSLTLDHGMTAAAAQGFAWFGVMLGHHQGRRDEAIRFTRLARALVERHSYVSFEAKSLFALEIASSWTQPADAVVDLARATFRAGLDGNDVAVACFACHHLVHDMLSRGDHLDVVQHEISAGLEFVRRNGFRDVEDELVTQERYVAALTGRSASLGDWAGDHFHSDAFEATLTRGRMPDMIFSYWVSRAQSLFIAGLTVQAKAALQHADEWTWSSPVHVRAHLHAVFWALVLADLETSPASVEGLRRIRSCRDRLKEWDRFGAPLFRGKLALVDAEIARLEGRSLDAARGYQEAVDWACANRLVHDAALAHEFAARHFDRECLAVAGRAHWRAARASWLRWGALAKVRQLDETHAFLREHEGAYADETLPEGPGDQLDLGTIIEASQALSGEIQQDRLIDKLMSLAVESAGAQRGLLMLANGAEWSVQAEATAMGKGVSVVLRQGVPTDADLPIAVLNRAVRAQSCLMLDDASDTHFLEDDPYCRNVRPRSVLCLPLRRQGRTVAVLYLENNLAPRVFTPGRVEMLALLASQAAISLEHARLVADLERENCERRFAEVEQARAQTALVASEQRFALAVTASDDGIWDWIAGGDELYTSPRWLEIYGFPGETRFAGREDLLRRCPLHPDDRGDFEQALTGFFRGAATRFSHELRIIRHGQTRWVHLSGLLSRDAAGRPDRWTGSATDVTDRKAGELALRDSEARFALAVAGSNAGIWDVELLEDRMFMSDRAQELLGLEVGANVRSLHEWGEALPFHADDAAQRADLLEDYLAGRAPAYDGDWRVLDLAGHHRWVHIRGVCQRDVTGHPTRIAGSVTDIDAQKRAEHALRQSEERHALAMEAARDGHWDWIIERDEFYVSPRLLEIYGFPPETQFQGRGDFLGRFPFYPEDLPRWQAQIAAHFGGTNACSEIEIRMLRQGEIRWIHLSGLLLRNAAGTPTRWIGSVSDVTERKAADAALRESEQRFALAVAGSNDGIWDIDLVGDRMFMSDRAQGLHGLEVGSGVRPRAEWRAVVAFHPDDEARLADMLEQYVAGRRDAYDCESRVRHPDGDYRWVRIRGHCLRDASGRATRVAGSISDIDAQKRAEQALTQSEQRHALAMEATRDGHWDWLVETDQLYVSPRLLEIYGFPPDARFTDREEFLRRLPLHAEDRPKLAEAMKAYFNGRTNRFDIDLRASRHKRPIWVNLSGLLSRKPTGQPLRWTGTASDITSRKAGELALRESEQRFALAVAGSNDGIWDVDMASDQMFLSERAQRLYGLEPGVTLRPRAQWDALVHFHPEDEPRQLEMVRRYLDGQLPGYDGEWRVRHADGAYHWVRVRGLCVRDPENRPMRMAGSVSDIDARRRAEAALQQSQRLEAVGTLAGGIAHDFNNILGAILGFGESAMGKTRAGSRIRRDLGFIVTAGERGRALVERILAFSRTGVGVRVPVHVEGIVQEALQLISSAADNLRIEARLSAGNAATLGDPTQIHQVLMNLLTNAVQAMPEGGVLRVSHDTVMLEVPRVVATSTLAAGEYLVLEIGDSGCGIVPEVLGRIFDPFFTTKDVGAGTGLGLSLAHGIVTEMAGAIDVSTEPGVGSTFTVYLPRAGEAAAPEQDEAPELPRGAHEQVLLVDDEEALLRLMTDTLTDLGYMPVGFNSGRDALAAFAAHPDRFDAVITDERMPGLTGAGLIRAVRKVRPSIPVLLVSGYLGPLIVEQARNAGADVVLRKPLSTPDLAHSLARVLQSRTRGAEAGPGLVFRP